MNRILFAVLFVVGIPLILFSQAQEQPTISTNWWPIAEQSPTPYQYEGQYFDWHGGEAVDFTIFQDTIGLWHLVSCIRYTQDPGNGEEVPRFFHEWVTDDLRNRMWKRKGIKLLYVDENRQSMRAPHGFKDNGKWYVYFDSGGSKALISEDGVTFKQWRNYLGSWYFFDMSRDQMVFNDKENSGKFISYFLQNPCGSNSVAYVGARTADKL